MKLIAHPKVPYSEIGQTKKIRLAFCNKVKEDEVKMLSYWMNCRDFFTDFLYLEEINKPYEIYFAKYDPANKKIDRDKVRIAIDIEKEEDIANIEKNIIILHDIEESNGLEKTVFTKISKGKYLYEGDSFWLNTSYSLNIYTFLIKVMGYKLEDGARDWINEMKETYPESVEGKYLLKFIQEFEEVLYKHLKDLFSNPTTIHGHTNEEYKSTAYAYFIHDHGGIVSFFDKNAMNYGYMKTNTYQQRMQEILKNGKA